MISENLEKRLDQKFKGIHLGNMGEVWVYTDKIELNLFPQFFSRSS